MPGVSPNSACDTIHAYTLCMITSDNKISALSEMTGDKGKAAGLESDTFSTPPSRLIKEMLLRYTIKTPSILLIFSYNKLYY